MYVRKYAVYENKLMKNAHIRKINMKKKTRSLFKKRNMKYAYFIKSNMKNEHFMKTNMENMNL